MTTNPISTVIGVFPDHDQANSAIDALRHTNFSYDRIRVVERGTGGFMDTLKGMFTGQASMASNTSDSLIKMGMPDYEAQHYQLELDANHVLLLMNADDRPEEAFGIMRQNGAFDINLRLRVASENDSVEAHTSNGLDETLKPTMPVTEADHNGLASSPVAPYSNRSQKTTEYTSQPMAEPSSVSNESPALSNAVDPSATPDLAEEPATAFSSNRSREMPNNA